MRRSGMTLLEMMVVLAIIGVLSAAAVPGISSWFSAQRLREATRSIADLVQLAREEAIRTRVNHVVFFGQDALGNALPNDSTGVPFAAAMLTDTDGDGRIDGGEAVLGVSPVPGVFWGTTTAAAGAPNDPDVNNRFNTGFTFVGPPGTPGAPNIQWIVFRPDGLPLAFVLGPYTEGTFGGAAGAVYLNDARREYAVVVSALGGVMMNVWEASGAVWR